MQKSAVYGTGISDRAAYVAMAQVHATLALAVATEGTHDADSEERRK